jgi:hypothetical protein
MITADPTVFPNNIVQMIVTRVPVAVDVDLTILRRALRPTDPNQSIGVYPNVWGPESLSFEMAPNMKNIPTMQDYRVFVQSFVKHQDEEEAINTHAVLAQRIRSMLYADELLQLAFADLVYTSNGKTERAMRWGPQAQRFMSNEVQGSFLQSSITEFWLQTVTQ